MISTVTTTTVTTLTSIATAGSLAVVGILMLLALLIQKELASGSESRYARALSRIVNVAIVPLLLGLAYIVVLKVIQAL
jgi:hypothetical protein